MSKLALGAVLVAVIAIIFFLHSFIVIGGLMLSVVLIVWGIAGSSRQAKKKAAAYDAFVQTNGFKYFSGTPPATPFSEYRGLHTETSSNGITGKLADDDFWLYSFDYETFEHKYFLEVLTIRLPATVPDFMLWSVADSSSEFVGPAPELNELKLEGDFPAHFRLFITPGSQDEVLSIITPNTMQDMITNGSYISIFVRWIHPLRC